MKQEKSNQHQKKASREMTKYTVCNSYLNETTWSHHHKLERALEAKERREGYGWDVVDNTGNYWDRDFDGNPCITRYAQS